MCTNPVTAYQPNEKDINGNTPLRFKPPVGNEVKDFIKIKVPCQNCVECHKSRTIDWAVRCHYEIEMAEKSSYFLTLTYNQENIPEHQSLQKLHLIAFHKAYKRKHNESLFFAVGEYGDSTKRPHYHSLLINTEIDDLILYRDGENKLYTSPSLNQIWGKGQVIIGRATIASAAYVAQYTAKKINGKLSIDSYAKYDKETGEIHTYREPEFMICSKKPYIGQKFLEKYPDDIYNGDNAVITGGKVRRPPKIYDKKLKQTDLPRYEVTKAKRKEKIKEISPDENRRRGKAQRVIQDQHRKGRVI